MIAAWLRLLFVFGGGLAAASAFQADQFQSAVHLQQQGRLEEAQRAYEKVLQAKPNHLQALANLGQLLLQRNRPAQAAGRLGRALELNPQLIPVRFLYALALFQSENHEAARQELAYILKLEPEHAQALHLLGLALLKLDRIEEGVASLEAALKANPANVEAAYTLGSVYTGRGEIDKAEALLAGPLAGSLTPEARLLRGIVLTARNEWQAAVAELTAALQAKPSLATLRTHLGHAYLLLGDYASAEKALLDELALHPSDFHASVYLGWLYLRERRYADATPYLRAALEKKPGHAGLLYLLGQVKQAAGSHEEAARLLERSVAAAPDFTPAHVLLARVYARLNRKEDLARQQRIIAKLNAAEQERNLGSLQSYGEKDSRALAGLAAEP